MNTSLAIPSPNGLAVIPPEIERHGHTQYLPQNASTADCVGELLSNHPNHPVTKSLRMRFEEALAEEADNFIVAAEFPYRNDVGACAKRLATAMLKIARDESVRLTVLNLRREAIVVPGEDREPFPFEHQ